MSSCIRTSLVRVNFDFNTPFIGRKPYKRAYTHTRIYIRYTKQLRTSLTLRTLYATFTQCYAAVKFICNIKYTRQRPTQIEHHCHLNFINTFQLSSVCPLSLLCKTQAYKKKPTRKEMNVPGMLFSWHS